MPVNWERVGTSKQQGHEIQANLSAVVFLCYPLLTASLLRVSLSNGTARSYERRETRSKPLKEAQTHGLDTASGSGNAPVACRCIAFTDNNRANLLA